MKREIKKQKEKIDRNEMEGRMKYGDRKVRTQKKAGIWKKDHARLFPFFG